MIKNAALNLPEAIIETEIFELFLNQLEKIRKEKPEQFIDTILAYINKSTNVNEYFHLRHRIKLSKEEESQVFYDLVATMTPEQKSETAKLILSREQKELFYLAETGQVGTAKLHQLETTSRRELLESLKLTVEEFDVVISFHLKRPIENEMLLASIQQKFSGWKSVGLFSTTPEPSGEELLKTAIQKIKTEKKYKKPSELLRFVKPRIEKAFAKPAKPFTNEQVIEGVRRYIATQKINTREKAVNDSRSRSRTNLTTRQWNNLMLEVFGSRRPEFAKKYQKAVRDGVGKIPKQQNAQKSSK